jgi:hypothetical protein
MKKLALSIPSERIIGFTIPRGGCFHVCDHDEVWLVQLGPPLVVEETDLEPYSVAERDDFAGWGNESKSSILHHGNTEISYRFDPYREHVPVNCSTGVGSETIKFPIFSGDWFTASLSADGRYLVLAEPYRIEVYDLG